MDQKTAVELLDLLDAYCLQVHIGCVVLLVALALCLALSIEAGAVARAAREAG